MGDPETASRGKESIERVGKRRDEEKSEREREREIREEKRREERHSEASGWVSWGLGF